MQVLTRGILIALEGIDGCGKSTLAQNLSRELLASAFPVLLTKEPGSSNLGKQLRQILQHQPAPLAPKAEYLLFAADRAEHFTSIVIPALTKKTIVISDRMSDSSIAYQGYGRGLDISMIKTVNRWAMNNITPDLTIYIHVPVDVAQERIRARNQSLTSFEQEQRSFIERLHHGFEEIFKDRTDVIRLDGLQSPAYLTKKALETIISWIETNKLLTR